jgi:hypothetical protein
LGTPISFSSKLQMLGDCGLTNRLSEKLRTKPTY